ncbi:MAG TPA: hypothetical protein VHU22_07505 [Xanthobacteraceae bacterium]|jgi:hypothetical protein|nr:hypothetical protein [Xanthobacteraceae bacterium]
MILASLFGATLIVAVATVPADPSAGATHLTPQQRSAATQPLVRSATDCIVHAVVSDPRYGAKPAGELGNQLGEIIVASMPACVGPVRAMIDAYDHYYGEGSGEAFFMGPYLDVLPKTVLEAGNKAPR